MTCDVYQFSGVIYTFLACYCGYDIDYSNVHLQYHPMVPILYVYYTCILFVYVVLLLLLIYTQNKGKEKIRRNFSDQIFAALDTERFREIFKCDLKLSNYLIVETDFLCVEPTTGMFTGRIVSTGEVNTTQLLNALQSWVKTKPTLKIRSDSVVVDRYCPVYYVPTLEDDYCVSELPAVEQPSTGSPSVSRTNSSEAASNRNTIIVIGAVVGSCVSIIILLVTIVCIILLYRRKKEGGGRFSR